jgi:hypothetical protein
MQRRPRRIFLAGLALSVLLHLALLSRGWIVLPSVSDDGDSTPIEARLAPPPPPVAIAPTVSAAKRAAPKPAAPKPARRAATPPMAEPMATANVAAEYLSVPAVIPEDATPAPLDMAAPDRVADAPENVVSVAAAPVAPLNAMPRRVTLEYRARYGLASGRQTLLWVSDGAHYTLTSVASASGLARLVFAGQLVQISRGAITAQGLQPEAFWDQRGSKHRQSRFDYVAQIILDENASGARTQPLPVGMQDTQSLLFQIALTAPPAADSSYPVFNGKNVRAYRYHLVGETMLDTAVGRLRALHIVRQTERPAEHFEVWLAVDRYYLPLKLATVVSGYDAELSLQSIVTEP